MPAAAKPPTAKAATLTIGFRPPALAVLFCLLPRSRQRVASDADIDDADIDDADIDDAGLAPVAEPCPAAPPGSSIPRRCSTAEVFHAASVVADLKGARPKVPGRASGILRRRAMGSRAVAGLILLASRGARSWFSPGFTFFETSFCEETIFILVSVAERVLNIFHLPWPAASTRSKPPCSTPSW